MAKPNVIYQLKVTLDAIKPPIWRQLQVKNCTLAELNEIIQDAMGWGHCHMWVFEIEGEEYGDDSEGDLDFLDAHKVSLSRFVTAGVKRFRYVYDFGDDWMHGIKIEKALEADPHTTYPICLAGARAAPPEDCGGPWGYADLVEAIKVPEKDSELLEWLGDDFDPEAFDVAAVNKLFGHTTPKLKVVSPKRPKKAQKSKSAPTTKRSTSKDNT